jgi:hypothetical protein
LQGLGNVNDGLGGAEFEIACLNGEVDACVHGVIVEGVGAGDEAETFEAVRNRKNGFALFDTKGLFNSIEIARCGKRITVHEQA